MVDLFLGRIAENWDTEIKTLTDSAKVALSGYSFPGNVRELENILERTVTLTEKTVIDATELALPENADMPSASTSVDTAAVKQLVKDEPNSTGLLDSLAENERNAIVVALEENRWNRTAAAKQLGLTLRQLRYRLEN